jgi:uncharacterized protein YjiS (DUF1127 family)
MTDLTIYQLTKYGGVDFANGARFRLLEGFAIEGVLTELRDHIRVWRRRSQERKELAGTHARELADMGFSVPDAKFEINKPFWRA